MDHDTNKDKDMDTTEIAMVRKFVKYAISIYMQQWSL
jgi:hypothetical protein